MKVTMPHFTGIEINGCTYVIQNVFSNTAKESVKDKLKRLILDNATEKINIKNSQKTNN